MDTDSLPLIENLLFWDDGDILPPAAHMARDEALFLSMEFPVLRAYRWRSRAVTFGFSQRWERVRELLDGRPCARRWTGGGFVEHGGDLTLSLAVPSSHELAQLPSKEIYRRLHLVWLGVIASVAASTALAGPGPHRRDSRCFEEPVADDILLNGEKIGGGALRRTANGFLYQGSLRVKTEGAAFARALASNTTPLRSRQVLLKIAHQRLADRYGLEDWLTMR